MKNKIIFTALVISLIGTSSVFALTTKQEQARLNVKLKQLDQRTKLLQQDIQQLEQKKATLSYPTHSNAERYAQGPAVVTSPYIGMRSKFDASDLLTNLPSMNEDLRLLRQRQKMENHLYKTSSEEPDRPIIELSGNIAGEALYTHDYNRDTSDIDLSGAELDVIANISPWATAAMLFSYDKNPPMLGSRVTNSRIQLSRGFVTIGNLQKFPLYMTIGQIYLPFGDYSNFMVSTPLTQSVARIKQRALVLGVYNRGIYGQVYAAQGDSYTKSHNGKIKQYGANLGYKYKQNKFAMDIGVGAVANMADSEGMQATYAAGINAFQGFGNGNSEQLKRLVPGMDMHAKFSYGLANILAEYITALRPFARQDLNFNGKGAHVRTLDAEGAYNFKVLNRPTQFALGYGRTWKSLMLNLPRQSYFAKISSSIWKDTVEALEFRHDVNYGKADYYTTFTNSSADIKPTGRKGRNIITGKVTLYF